MNIALFEVVGPTSKPVIKSGFDSLEGAEAFARSQYKILFYERDQDTDNCADFITKDGRQFAIEPA
jgi:hypothetical protein